MIACLIITLACQSIVTAPASFMDEPSEFSIPESRDAEEAANSDLVPPWMASKRQSATGPVTLRVFGLRGKNLRAADMSGTSDPYLVLSCAGETFQTSVIRRNVSPKWLLTDDFLFSSPKVAITNVLTAKVYDHNNVSNDECIGEVEFRLQSLYGRPGERIDMTEPVYDRGVHYGFIRATFLLQVCP